MKLSKKQWEKFYGGYFFILAADLCGSQQTLDYAGSQCFQHFIDGSFLSGSFLNGIRNVNFWEILFSIAFICIIYDDQLGITALHTVDCFRCSITRKYRTFFDLRKKRVDTNLPFLLSMTVTATTRMRSTLVKISKLITILAQPSNT